MMIEGEFGRDEADDEPGARDSRCRRRKTSTSLLRSRSGVRQVTAALRRALEEQDLITHNAPRCDLGPVLHSHDLAADKMLAFWGRARPRDFFDIAALIERYGHERLLELAEAKDARFSRETFIDAIRAIARLSNADWAEDGIDNADAQRLRINFDVPRFGVAGRPVGSRGAFGFGRR